MFQSTCKLLFMSSIIKAMGYDCSSDIDGNGNAGGAGDFSIEGCSKTLIRNSNGTESSDWIDFAYTGVDCLQPGDIISNGNHVEMFLYKNGNGDYQQFGFNAGDTDPIYASVDLADRIIQYSYLLYFLFLN